MSNFILGYGYTPDGSVTEELVEFTTAEEASFNSEEWCNVEAETLEEAKEKYEVEFIKWQNKIVDYN